MSNDSMEERSPTAPTKSPVPAMEASQADARVKEKESPFSQENNSHPGGTTGMNQIIYREASSDEVCHGP